MQARTVARWLLTLALAYVFLSFGVGKIGQPPLWIDWIPPSLEGVLGLTRNAWLLLFGIIEILLALLLLVPRIRLQKIVVGLMILHLLAVLTQTGFFTDIGVRDTGLLLAAVALFFFL